MAGGKAAGKAAEGIIAKAVADLFRTVGKDAGKDAARDVERDAARDAARTAARDAERDAARDAERDAASDAERRSERDAAQSAEGRQTSPDPVDVATGEVVLSQLDVRLPGILPLLLSRTHVSSYRYGRFFGPSWASTLDMRVELSACGVRFLGEDGMVLQYPRPAAGGRVLPSAGPRWPLADAGGGRFTVTDPQRGRVWSFAGRPDSPAASLPLAAVSDLTRQHRFEVDRDGDGVPTEVRHAGGYRIAVESAGGLVTGLRLRGAAGGADVPLMRFGYTGERLTEVVNPSGRPMRLAYDPAGRLVSWVDRNGGGYRYEYDERGRCVSGAGTDGYLTARFDYGDGRTVLTDSLGRQTGYELNELGQLVRQTDPLGRSTDFDWDRYDRLLRLTDPLGNTTAWTYDQAGDLVRVTGPDGAVVTAGYDAAHRATAVTGPAGGTWAAEYDRAGNLTAVTDPAGATTRYGYHPDGRPASVTDALGRRQQLETDPAGLLTVLTDPDGALTRYQRDGFGRVSAVTDPLGNTTRYGWTVTGELARRVLPDGATDRWSYDAEGNLVAATDPLGQVTTTTFGPFDLPLATMAPDGQQTAFSYDTELRLTGVIGAAGQLWSYRYDAAGRLVSETDINDRTVSYGYDAAGHLVSRTGVDGQVIGYRRDPGGNLLEQQDPDGSVTRYVRDRAGRVVQATGPGATVDRRYDPLGRLLAETTDGRTVTFGYDPLGRRTSRRTPSGVDSRWEYGPVHDLPVALSTGRQTVRFGYDAAGREVARRIGPQLLFVQGWDANARLSTQTVTAGGPAGAAPGSQRLLHRRSFGYRADGLLTAVDDQLSGAHQYTVDRAGRVTAVAGPGWSERYAYDPLGNALGATWPSPAVPATAGAAGDPTAAGDPAAGARTYTGSLVRAAGRTSYRHDAAGRLVARTERTLSGSTRTWRYRWNAADQLTDVDTPDGRRWQYRYDPFGRRVGKRRLGDDGSVVEQTVFCWDGTQLAEQALAGPAAPTTTWDYRPGSFEPVTQTDTVPRQGIGQDEVDRRFYAIVADLAGAPTELITPDGALAWQQRRTLWGTVVWTGGAGGADCPLRFPGQYFDAETGQHYNYLRNYDPATAAYTAPDPLGLAAGPNPHAYVPNPTAWVDPLGLAKCEGQKVYRQLSAADKERFEAGQGLFPKGTSGDIAAHVAGEDTKHISASLTKEQAGRFASGNGLVEIDVREAISGGSKFVDHNNVVQAATRGGGPRLKQFAERAGEVLFIDGIPFHAMKLVK